MDIHPTNHKTLGRPMTKRQSPCTQVFNQQTSNSAGQSHSEMNLPTNDVFMHNEHKPVNLNSQHSHYSASTSQETCQSPPQDNPRLISTHSKNSDSTTMLIEEEDDEDAAPIRDVLRKKVKTTMITTANDMKSNRRVSFEEEKGESEHSTTCDTRSDFNIANDATDFMVSPSIVSQHSKDPSELKLDGEDDNVKSIDVSLNLNPDEIATNLKIVREIAQQLGDLTDSDFTNDSEPKFKCHLNHQIGVSSGSSSKKGCSRCEALLEECREFARKNGGRCVNDEYEETVRYQCQKGHNWSLNHKNARRRWCALCAKEQRQFLKKKCEEEKIEREKQEEECQKKLFEEARKKAATGNAHSTSGSQPFNLGGKTGADASSGRKGMTTLEYFQKMDYEIETLAKKYTIEYMSQKTFRGDVTYNQILQVYKIMIMPEEVLQCYMFNLNAETLRSEFRRMAKMIHPDKNKHPHAGNAFQKIHKVYEIALNRLEGPKPKP